MATNAPAPASAEVAVAATNAFADQDIRGVKPPVELSDGAGWIGWLLLVLCLAAAPALIKYFRRPKEHGHDAEPVVPPDIRALEQLRRALPLLDRPGPFCVKMSDAIRAYLEDGFDLKAPERTTEEFLEEARSSALLSSVQKQQLGHFFAACDLVKFARDDPGQDPLRSLHAGAMSFVRETRLRPGTSDAASAGQTEPTGGIED